MANEKKKSSNIGYVIGIILALLLLAALLWLVMRSFSSGSAQAEAEKNVQISLKDRTVRVDNEIKLIDIDNAEKMVGVIEWSSSDESIATVSRGKVKGVSPGIVKVTAYLDNKEIGSCSITVEEAEPIKGIDEPKEGEPTGIHFESFEYELRADEIIKLSPTVEPDSAIDKSLTWSSSNNRIALVREDGTVIGIDTGTATITAKTVNGLEASVTVKVEGRSINYDAYMSEIDAMEKGEDNPPVEEPDPESPNGGGSNNDTKEVTSIALNYTSVELNVGGSGTLVATVYPSDATSKKVTWSSSNTKVATVDSKGKVVGKKAGTVTITAKTSNGVKATCKVVVVGSSGGSGSSGGDSGGGNSGGGSSGGGSSSKIDPTYITLSHSSVTLGIGETKKISVIFSPSDVTNKDVTWSSNNTKIATVDGNGNIKGISEGTTSVKVTTSNGLVSQARVTVTSDGGGGSSSGGVDAKSISLNKTSISLTVGNTSTLSVTFNPSDTTNKTISWYSGNALVAKVNNNGVVTAMAAGTTTITAMTSNGVKATCTVTVSAIAPSSITLNKSSAEIIKGATVTIKATIAPSNADQTVTWTSSDSGVATVSNGVVKGIKAGTVTITAKTSNKKTATCKVTVTPILVTSILITNNYPTITVGSSTKLNVSITPTNADNKTLTYTSDKTSIATVDSSGNVKGIAVGTAKITVKNAASGKTAVANVTVNPVRVTGVSITNCPTSIKKGKTYQMKWTVSPSNATNKAVNWETGNKNFYTVSDSGLVKVNGIPSKGSKVATVQVVTKDGSKIATCNFNLVT